MDGEIGGSSPERERQRMLAVRRYDILDTPPDGSFDNISAVAARLFATPIAIISIVDDDRIWFKSRHGLDVQQIDREPGLCASAILDDTSYLLTDALTDPRSMANPLVAGDFGLRFYLGAPLRTSDGHNLGTLCVIDREPRVVTQAQIDSLEHLASLVVDQLELRLSARRAVGELSHALNRSALMGREIDHRVMNSLQFVSNLLAMQGRAAGGEAQGHLNLAANRVSAVARVHRHFYLDEAVERTCGLRYLERLCADYADLLEGVSVEVEGEPTQIRTTQVMALGLIVNELVSNAAKFGATRVAVDLRATDKGHLICVTDNGPGLPEDFDPAQSQGLGMRVIRALVKDHAGELSIRPTEEGGGACFCVTLSTPA